MENISIFLKVILKSLLRNYSPQIHHQGCSESCIRLSAEQQHYTCANMWHSLSIDFLVNFLPKKNKNKQIKQHSQSHSEWHELGIAQSYNAQVQASFQRSSFQSRVLSAAKTHNANTSSTNFCAEFFLTFFSLHKRKDTKKQHTLFFRLLKSLRSIQIRTFIRSNS